MLLHMFNSKTHLYKELNMDHITLDKLLDSGLPYLSRFTFSLIPKENMSVESIMSLLDFKLNYNQEKSLVDRSLQIRSIPIFAKNILDENLSEKYTSLNSCCIALKADRVTVRDYLLGKKGCKYFRKQ
jgi:hypothetical protein